MRSTTGRRSVGQYQRCETGWFGEAAQSLLRAGRRDVRVAARAFATAGENGYNEGDIAVREVRA